MDWENPIWEIWRAKWPSHWGCRFRLIRSHNGTHSSAAISTTLSGTAYRHWPWEWDSRKDRRNRRYSRTGGRNVTTRLLTIWTSPWTWQQPVSTKKLST